MDLAAMREHYARAGLDESDLAPDPMTQFAGWFTSWASTNPYDANLATLATVDADGWPSSRAVLVKGADTRGFVFFTNRNSVKARAIERTGRAAMTFVWREIERQIRVVGSVEPTYPTTSPTTTSPPGPAAPRSARGRAISRR